MAKIIGLLLTVVGIWVALEVYQKGTEHALGGLFASSDSQSLASDRRSAPQRAGAAVRHAQEEADARRSRLLGD